MSDYILAIDPGNIQSAYVVSERENLKPVEFDILPNDELLDYLNCKCEYICDVVIEMVASYGMAVGETVFDTVFWIGRFYEAVFEYPCRTRMKRMDVKMHICHNSRAKDTNIRQALIDRFAQHDKKRGTGTKANPDWFYGFKADIWAAYALGVTYAENQN